MSGLSIDAVTKQFGDFRAVDDVSLSVPHGTFVCLLGPSGCGKTTLLRMIAGLEEPTSGTIALDGADITDVPTHRRNFGMVFQSLALFPHRSVGQNIEFPLKIRGVAAAERKKRALQLMELLRLREDYYGKSVVQISGGERQRVALARALAFDPEILFFDEPLSALDYRLRKTLEKELKDLHARTGKTFVYITHSLEEAMVMSDRIGVMRAGRLVQVGTPQDIYSAPKTRFVSEFIGDVNVLPVTADGASSVRSAPLGKSFRSPVVPDGFRDGYLVVRPEFLRFLAAPGEADNSLEGRLYNEYVLGSRVQYQVRVGDQVFIVEKLRQQVFEGRRDDMVLIGWNAADSILVTD